MTIRICIVDDDPEMQGSLKAMLKPYDDMDCIAVFSDEVSFSSNMMDMDVHVVLMDINMPGNSGIQAVAKWKPRRPEVQFMMCTVFDEPDKIFNALCAGATGYILKSAPPEELIESIREIYKGGSPMSAQVARRVVESFQQRKTDSESVAKISPREWELLSLLDKGYRYKEIADQLHLTFETVKTYIRNLYEKLHVSSRMDAVNKVFPKR